MSSDSKKVGRVYIIGAGPGHPDLITRLGYDILQSCQAIVYDDLISLELIVGLSDTVEKYYVGKRAKMHSVPQDHICRLLIELARRGLDVARLKGGDPMVFGRGGEEITELSEACVPYMIIPGITAITAAAACAGIPLTDRRSASWMMAVTGREANSPSPEVPWEEISHLKGGTLGVYMGVNALGNLVEKLTVDESDSSIPAAVIQSAYQTSQQIVKTTLGELPAACRSAGISSPAMILIGDSVSMSNGLISRETGPLAGRRVLVTHHAGRPLQFCKLLREAGAEPILLPTILIKPYADNVGWERFRRLVDLGGWCVFTSHAGVNSFMEELFQRGNDLRALGRFKIAVIGPATANALNEFGITADLSPGNSTVTDLIDALKSHPDVPGKTVVRIRGDRSDKKIEDRLESFGIGCIPITTYRTVTADWEMNWKKRVIETPPQYITFSGRSMVDAFVEILGEDAEKVTNSSKVVSIGPLTTAAALKRHIKVTIEAEIHTINGMVEAILKDAECQ